jgi:hypothetical protein
VFSSVSEPSSCLPGVLFGSQAFLVMRLLRDVITWHMTHSYQLRGQVLLAKRCLVLLL